MVITERKSHGEPIGLYVREGWLYLGEGHPRSSRFDLYDAYDWEWNFVWLPEIVGVQICGANIQTLRDILFLLHFTQQPITLRLKDCKYDADRIRNDTRCGRMVKGIETWSKEEEVWKDFEYKSVPSV